MIELNNGIDYQVLGKNFNVNWPDIRVINKYVIIMITYYATRWLAETLLSCH